MSQTETTERPDLEIVEAPSESLQDDEVQHIACCQWPFYVLTGKKHYALCGVELTEQQYAETKEPCKVCDEIERTTKGAICPMRRFTEGP